MKYVSIDTETMGLDDEYCQILEIGAIVDDLSKPMLASRLWFKNG